jgi:hypothetical protein
VGSTELSIDLSTGTTATQFTTGTSSKVEHSPACCHASKGAYWREDAAFGGPAGALARYRRKITWASALVCLLLLYGNLKVADDLVT